MGAEHATERPKFEVFTIGEKPAYKVVTTLRIDVDLLRRLDQQARKRGISRTAYLIMAASKALESGM